MYGNNQDVFEVPELGEYMTALKSKEILQRCDPHTKYTLGSELGGGAYATVYKVIRKSDEREFAMKIIKYKAMNFTEKEKANMITEIGIL